MLEFVSTWDPKHRVALEVIRREKAARSNAVVPSKHHLDDAVGWIKRAQDSDSSGGVAWGYRARRAVGSNDPIGWVPPYPETTGYIIATMLRYGQFNDDADSIERARRMVNWEIAIQLPDGGIQGGIYGAEPVASSTFVTGQVLFGLVSAYEFFREEPIKTSAMCAGNWLLSCLDHSGRFVKGFSHFCEAGAKAYEARTGLALAELGDVLNDHRYRDGASRIADYALSCQQSNGWFRENDLDTHDVPLTHTIGYVLEGLEGIGNRLGRDDCHRAVTRTLDSILPLIREGGFLAGRWCQDWTPAVDWACLTGSAQIAGVFLRMYRKTRNPEYLEAGRQLLGFVCFTQELGSGVPDLKGGIRGSYPFQGGYGQWCVLNWATKFFADSMMDLLAVPSPAH